MRKKFSFVSQIETVWAMTFGFTKRYFRDKVALFFTFLFPLVFLFVFGFIFGGNDGPNFSVVIENNATSEFASGFVQNASNDELFDVKESESRAEAEEQLGRGQIDAIIELPENFGEINEAGFPSGELKLFYDESDEQLATTLKAVLEGILEGINSEFVVAEVPFILKAEPLKTANLTRFDYTLAGLIGFAIMSLGIFSMSEGFTGDKKSGSLRRLEVAPVKPWQLILATALNRIFVGIISVASMFVMALLVFDFNMRGNYFVFLLFTILATIMMFGFGMAIAGWAKDSNQAAPLSNLVSFPMMFLSGVFFPVFLMPDALQKVTAYIPLTPVVEGLRLILTEGASFIDLGPQLLIIGGWTIIIYLLAFRTFRWE
ncbi:MAG: ABC transporter permease [bacterium]|nr:ABC transporter permease [bacterium]